MGIVIYIESIDMLELYYMVIKMYWTQCMYNFNYYVK
jgi:hypothetical protein